MRCNIIGDSENAGSNSDNSGLTSVDNFFNSPFAIVLIIAGALVCIVLLFLCYFFAIARMKHNEKMIIENRLNDSSNNNGFKLQHVSMESVASLPNSPSGTNIANMGTADTSVMFDTAAIQMANMRKNNHPNNNNHNLNGERMSRIENNNDGDGDDDINDLLAEYPQPVVNIANMGTSGGNNVIGEGARVGGVNVNASMRSNSKIGEKAGKDVLELGDENSDNEMYGGDDNATDAGVGVIGNNNNIHNDGPKSMDTSSRWIGWQEWTQEKVVEWLEFELTNSYGLGNQQDKILKFINEFKEQSINGRILKQIKNDGDHNYQSLKYLQSGFNEQSMGLWLAVKDAVTNLP